VGRWTGVAGQVSRKETLLLFTFPGASTHANHDDDGYACKTQEMIPFPITIAKHSISEK
jgi:hypothetical protein